MIAGGVVIKSFKKTGIWNALNMTDDHVVWDGDEAPEADLESVGNDEATTGNVSSTDSV